MARKQNKRKRGMGSIFKHGHSWYIGYRVNGKLVRERIGNVQTLNKAVAERALKARLGEIVKGKFDLEKFRAFIPLGKLIDNYLGWAEVNQKSCDRERIALKKFLGFIGDKPINQVSSWDIEQYKSQRKKEGVKPSTINRELNVIKSMFNRAINWEEINHSPMKGVKKAKPLNKDEYEREPKYIPSEALDKILNASSVNLIIAVTILRNTGMRASELINLRWEDVDLEREQFILRTTKNFTQRVVPINATVIKIINSIQNRESKVCYYKNKDSLGSTWRKVLKRLNLQYTIHDLRHSFITDLVTSGVDIVTVMEITGHKDIRMLKRYTHPTLEHKKNAVNLVKMSPNVPSMFTHTHNASKKLNVIS